MRIRIRVIRIIIDGITEYNEYRSPEATTKLLSYDNKSFRIEFSGSFCETCGFYDYFDDYKIVLEDKGLDTKIVDITEIDGGAVVTFEVVDSELL